MEDYTKSPKAIPKGRIVGVDSVEYSGHKGKSGKKCLLVKYNLTEKVKFRSYYQDFVNDYICIGHDTNLGVMANIWLNKRYDGNIETVPEALKACHLFKTPKRVSIKKSGNFSNVEKEYWR